MHDVKIECVDRHGSPLRSPCFLSVTTPAIDRLAAFYARLGMTIAVDRDDANREVCTAECQGFVATFTQGDPPVFMPTTVFHFVVDDLASTVAEIADHDGQVAKKVNDPVNGTRFVIKDPEGRKIILGAHNEVEAAARAPNGSLQGTGPQAAMELTASQWEAVRKGAGIVVLSILIIFVTLLLWLVFYFVVGKHILPEHLTYFGWGFSAPLYAASFLQLWGLFQMAHDRDPAGRKLMAGAALSQLLSIAIDLLSKLSTLHVEALLTMALVQCVLGVGLLLMAQQFRRICLQIGDLTGAFRAKVLVYTGALMLIFLASSILLVAHSAQLQLRLLIPLGISGIVVLGTFTNVAYRIWARPASRVAGGFSWVRPDDTAT